jgi:hypothetical protein
MSSRIILCIIMWFNRSRDSSVCLRAGRQEGISSVPGRVNHFIVPTSFSLALWPNQPPTHWVPTALLPEVKRPGLGACNSAGTSVEVKRTCNYTLTRPYAFMALGCFTCTWQTDHEERLNGNTARRIPWASALSRLWWGAMAFNCCDFQHLP